MGTLADLVGGFQGGYGFSQDARRQRQLDKLYGLEIDKRMMDRKGQYDDFMREGAKDPNFDPVKYGISSDPNEMGMGQTIGEKIWTRIKAPFVGASTQAGTEMETGQEEEGQKTGGAGLGRGTIAYAEGGPIRLEDGGAVRHAIPTYQRRRAYTPSANVSYADGGDVDERRTRREPTSEEGKRARSRKEARTGRAQAPNPTSTQTVPGKTRGYTARERINKLAGGKSSALNLDDAWNKRHGVTPRGLDAKPAWRRGARGVARFAGRAVTPALATASAYDSYHTGTEEYQRRGGIYDKFAYDEDDSNLEMFGKDLATRAIGTFEDLGHTLTGGFFRPDSYDQDPAVSQAVEANVKAEPPPPEQTGAQPAQADPPGTGGQQQAIQPKDIGPKSDGDITTPDEIHDMSSETTTIQPIDIPRHSTSEWEADRLRARRNAVLRGMDPNEVDDAITATQIKNFSSYAYQAHAHLIRGDMMGAARALTAGYQYFPNGSDVNFGIMKGKDGKEYLVGLGTDEQTGERKGNPTVVTAQTLAAMVNQAQDPAAWNRWTLDNQEHALKEKEYMLDKDYKEHMLGIEEFRAISGRIAAEAGLYRAMASVNSGAGGLQIPSESEVLAAEKAFAENYRLYSEQTADWTQDDITGLVSLSAGLYAQTGVPHSVIASYVIKAMDQGLSPEQIRDGFMMAVQGEGQGAIEAP